MRQKMKAIAEARATASETAAFNADDTVAEVNTDDEREIASAIEAKKSTFSPEASQTKVDGNQAKAQSDVKPDALGEAEKAEVRPTFGNEKNVVDDLHIMKEAEAWEFLEAEKAARLEAKEDADKKLAVSRAEAYERRARQRIKARSATTRAPPAAAPSAPAAKPAASVTTAKTASLAKVSNDVGLVASELSSLLAASIASFFEILAERAEIESQRALKRAAEDWQALQDDLREAPGRLQVSATRAATEALEVARHEVVSTPDRLKSAAIVKLEMAKQEVESAPERLKSAAIVKLEIAKQEVESAPERLKTAAIVTANVARDAALETALTVRKEIEMAPTKARLAAEEAVEAAKLRAQDEVESAKTAVVSAPERLARKLRALPSTLTTALRETIIAQVDRARAKLDSSKHRLSDVRVQVEVSRAALLEELNMKK